MTQAEPLDDPYDGDWIECWQCGGEGCLYDCIDGQCMDAESGCDDCEMRCDICKGKGGWKAEIGSNQMTFQEIEILEQLMSAATKGHRTITRYDHDDGSITYAVFTHQLTFLLVGQRNDANFPNTKNDINLEVAAVNALPALCEEWKRMREALTEIAKQKKTDELETMTDVEYADFEDGYDASIDRARAALGGI